MINKKVLQDEILLMERERKFRLSLSLLISAIVLLSLLAVAAMGFVAYNMGGRKIPVIEEVAHPAALFTLLAIFSILMGTLVSVLVSWPILRPLNRLINGMNRLAKGDYKARLEGRGMLNTVPIYVESREAFNKLAEELEGTAMLRSDFINNFSHEFKTPIVSIAGFAKLLQQEDLTEEERKEYLAIIEAESLRLSAMSNNVLSMSRVEKQTILTDVTEYNLSEQLRSSCLLLESKWEQQELEMDLLFDEHRIRANQELMAQVWVNLLDNAVKFTPPKGKVSIRIFETGRTVRVSISNTGSEIPEDKRERIFRKFYQADESHQSEGNGIGLAIVRYVVELHKGKVSVESRDMVTTFTVVLPKGGAG